jgi:cation diffusion facilitator CzcD-associated flavoprotein CzcO
MRSPAAGQKPTQYATLDEHYDLVVVGGGLSGLAAGELFDDTLRGDVYQFLRLEPVP